MELEPRNAEPVTEAEIQDTMEKLSQLISLEQRGLGFDSYGSQEDKELNDEDYDEGDYIPPQNSGGWDPDGSEWRTPTKSNFIYEPELINNVKRAANEIFDMLETGDSPLRRGESGRRQILPVREQQNSEATFRKRKTQQENEELNALVNKTVERLYQADSRYKEKITAMQYRKYKEELSMLRDKPEISQASKNLAKNLNVTPIHERTREVLNKKQENLVKLKAEVDSQREKSQETYTFQPEKFTKSRNRSEVRTTKEFMSHVYAWQSRKNETIQKEKYDSMTKELEGLTFRPYINDLSRRLASKGSEQQSMHQRFIKYSEASSAKKRELLEKITPTFKPALRKKTQTTQRGDSKKENQSYIKSPDQSHRNTSNSAIKAPKIITRTFMDLSENHQQVPEVLSTPMKRSLTPEILTNIKNKTSKVQQVEYTPEMEFLVKRIAGQKSKD